MALRSPRLPGRSADRDSRYMDETGAGFPGPRPPEAMTPDVGVVVPAAGMGLRMGGVKKAFLRLDGDPVLRMALQPFLARSDVRVVVVALPAEDAASPPDWLTGADPRVRVVAGGRTRAESVRAGLAALPDEVAIVVVHDGARPLVAEDTVARCLGLAREGKGGVAGRRATDTLKEVDSGGRVTGTPNRARFWHAQTPQAFPRRLLEDAYARSELLAHATDDASLVELAGYEVVMVECPGWNLKVTRPEDLDLAVYLHRSRRP